MHCQNLRSPIKLPLIYHLLVIIINTNRQNIIALQTPCVSPRSEMSPVMRMLRGSDLRVFHQLQTQVPSFLYITG